MADFKISDLNPAGTLNGNEITPVVQGGATVKATIAQLSAKVQNDVLPVGTDGIADK